MSEETKTPVEVLLPEIYVEYSKEIGELAGALATAQLEFDPLLKDTDNPYYHSKYADLSSVIKATQKPLAKQGLVVIQSPVSTEQTAGVITMLAHKSGQWHKSTLMLPAVMAGKDGKARFDAQSVGSAITYARRYSYQSAIGVAAEIDDDANKAVGIGSREGAQAVGQEKIAKLKQKMAGNGDAQASLFYALQPSGLYAVTGDVDLMRKIYKQFKANLHQDKDGNFYMVSDEQLEVLKFECESGNIPLKVLKGPNA